MESILAFTTEAEKRISQMDFDGAVQALDMEYTFGILKARWRWLRSEIIYKDKAIIGYAMKTAAILLNVLL